MPDNTDATDDERAAWSELTAALEAADRPTGAEVLVALAYASDAMTRLADRYAAEGMNDQARDWAAQRAIVDRLRGRP